MATENGRTVFGSWVFISLIFPSGGSGSCIGGLPPLFRAPAGRFETGFVSSEIAFEDLQTFVDLQIVVDLQTFVDLQKICGFTKIL